MAGPVLASQPVSVSVTNKYNSAYEVSVGYSQSGGHVKYTEPQLIGGNTTKVKYNFTLGDVEKDNGYTVIVRAAGTAGDGDIIINRTYKFDDKTCVTVSLGMWPTASLVISIAIFALFILLLVLVLVVAIKRPERVTAKEIDLPEF